MRTTKRSFLATAGVLVGSTAVQQITSATETSADAPWPSYQGDAQNTGYNPDTSSPVTAFTTDWTVRTGNRIIEAAPVFANGLLYVGSTDRSLYAIDPERGTEVWSVDTGAAIRDTPAVTEEAVVVVTRDHEAVGLHPDSGDER